MRLSWKIMEYRKTSLCKKLCFNPFVVSILTVFVAGFFANVSAASSSSSSFNLLDARQKGVSNEGTAKGRVISTFDESTNKDILEFNYTIPQSAAITVWSKNFPATLTATSVKTAKISVKVASAEQASQVSLKLDFKGSAGVQSIPVQLKSGWNSISQPIDWEKIGDLSEVDFVVGAAGSGDMVTGTLSFAIDFVNQAPAKKASSAPVTAPASITSINSSKAPVSQTVVAKPQVKTFKPRKTAVNSENSEKPVAPVTSAPVPVVSAFSILSAKEKIVTPSGSAKGRVVPTCDEVVDKDILEFDYTLSKGSALTISTKNFPAALTADSVNTAKIGVRLSNSGQASQISLEAQIQGAKGVQNIPVQLKSGWNSIKTSIDRTKLGELKGVDFILAPVGDVDVAKGILSLAVDFVKLSTPAKTDVSMITPYFSLLDAGEKGVFNIGQSQGSIKNTFDETLDKDVWQFDYSVPVGSVVGIWTKSYHPDLNSFRADAVKIGVNVPKGEQLLEVSVKVEVKGTTGMQTIPLNLKSGRNSLREPISWGTIGQLTEVVFVVSPMAGSSKLSTAVGPNQTAAAAPAKDVKAASGTFYFDVEFNHLSFLQKNLTFVKIGLIVLAGFLLFLLASLFGGLLSRGDSNKLKLSNVERFNIAVRARANGSALKMDFFFGVIAVLMGGAAVNIFALGTTSPLDAGFNFNFLGLALLGVLIPELLMLKLAGRNLSAGELLQNLLATGLLAASSSKVALLAAPGSWNQLFMLNNLIATITFLVYHILNASTIGSSGKQLRIVTAVVTVVTPYLFSWLLLVENITLIQTVLNGITGGVLAAWPLILAVTGRLLVAFVFNEAVTNGISLVTKGKWLNSGKAHFYIFLVSLGVVIAPQIADLGSVAVVASLPVLLKGLVAVITTMLSYAGLWGEVYLITGIALDGGKRIAPTDTSIFNHVNTGMRKGMAYSGILVAILYVLSMLLGSTAVQKIMAAMPILIGIISGALVFPLITTIIETFDGSIRFFDRAAYSYRNAILYLRGAVVGFGFAYMVTNGMFRVEMSARIAFGLLIGFLASGGVSVLRDILYAMKGQGRIQTWRLYFVDSLLGAFIGSAAAFYLDALQVPVIIEKFKLYLSAGIPRVDYITYPLINKWGRIDLGGYTGGVKLLFTESLAGVINWSIAAWLFAINKVFMQAYFEKDKAPIKFFFSKAGFATLVEHMIYVLRWGLWMAPIIFTFLRMMPNPTWYNQDGAIRTLFATYNNLTMSPSTFQAWSLQMFIYVLAFDFFRILIWMDHMGLRVATLVNLSFLGMDKLDERIAKFIGPAAAQRYIPEAVKRFTTWGPLLIPFYLPRGEAWDYAWSTSEAIQNANRGKGFLAFLQSLTWYEMALFIAACVLVCTGVACLIRALGHRSRQRRIASYELENREYKVALKENGEIYSELLGKECDITRRTYDIIDPCGRILFLVDPSQSDSGNKHSWPIIGNFPQEKFETSHFEKTDSMLKVVNIANGIRTTIEIRLPDLETTAELWNVTVENLTDQNRQLKVVPYLEWVLQGGIHDRFHTQYSRLFPEMEYVSKANAVLAWQKGTKSIGILAADIAPEGFLTSRMDFIGRARSIWEPRIFETFDFLESRDTAPYPTFDPIGSLMLGVTVEARASKSVRLMVGYAKNKEAALDLIQKHLKPHVDRTLSGAPVKKKFPLIGHGEIPPGTPQPYSEYIDQGRKLLVHTPFTPRPYDHAMSNEIHSVMVTNRGLHTSCNGNSQQNRLTPDWPDTVTKEIPAEAIYLYDPDSNEWFSPTYHPLNKTTAKHESEFGVDGTAVFRMTDGSLSTELTVFVPPTEPTGVYLLTVKNTSDKSRRMRVAPYFQMVLSFQPERAGNLPVEHDKISGALYFENPRNIFRSGWAFASMSIPAKCVETLRGRFFGSGRGVTRPFFVEEGRPDIAQYTDIRQIAGFLGSVEIPAHGECTISVILGQADDKKEARQIVQKYKNIQNVQNSLEETRNWWLSLIKTAEINTNNPEFDHLQNWLKYQAIAERVWARRGFYQTSGAYGFRDQLQDTVNLIWVDPALARKQIILHASHQFYEGDVYHWFFTLTDGRTAFSCRSQASDNPVWLAWGAVEYVRATGDHSILDEVTSYVSAEFPYAPLPKNKGGWGHIYHRSTRSDSVYRHCLRSLDLVLEKRTGKNGLPLIQTGDWNDGLDEIGSEGKGESIWLGFFVYYILKNMLDIIEKKDGAKRKEHYQKKMTALGEALEKTWREDRYLRAFHDDGTEIGIKGSGVWEIDALTAAWAVMAGINQERALTVFNTALSVLEKENAILLGWPALREDTKPYLGRSSKYPEGVRENGMYCHGVQWLVRAARILSEQFQSQGNEAKAKEYREIAYRLWLKISPISHVVPQEIEIYGGQPNKQSADILTNFDQGRMIWHGYTGAAGWMLRQAFEGVVGATLEQNELVLPADLDEPRGGLIINRVFRDVTQSPLKKHDASLRKNIANSLRANSFSKGRVTISAPEADTAVKTFRSAEESE
ncbi:MAG: hypothetical protein HZC17_05265 [Candidatus Omnitrophica bacterium]|nr:hypothetical protein [Candidatus Omnitrophota bacterium]